VLAPRLRQKPLAAKQLDHQFVQHIIAGLDCSPFEAEAVLQAVHQIYTLLFECSPALRPGQIFLPVVSVEAPPGPRLIDSRQTLVVLTLEDLNEDLQVRKTGGVLALRRHRLVRVCDEALQQGGLLSIADRNCTYPPKKTPVPAELGPAYDRRYLQP
jgi:hypothetical protein